jgi:ferredoxin
MVATEVPCSICSVSIDYLVNAECCIRCGSCAILAPGVFSALRRVELVRQPETEHELAGCRAAAIVCPTGAIRAVERP